MSEKSRMRRAMLALCACACACMYAGAHAQAPGPQETMQRMAGVYKHRFMSGAINPGKSDDAYQAEDVIEIVPFDAGHVYVRAHLEFYNGHSCDIAGIARYEHGAFVYHDPERVLPDDPPCAFKVGIEKDRLVMTDRATPDGIASCRSYCGARGSLDYGIGMDKRRPIRYLERLKASRQYAKAIDDLRKTEP